MYDYSKIIREDIINHIAANYTLSELWVALEDKDAFCEQLVNDCWIADSVTGNASGSYTFCSADAKSYVIDNMDLCAEALEGFGVDLEIVAQKFLTQDWEYFDVTIRCYLLYSVCGVIVEALDACREAIKAESIYNKDSKEALEKALAA